MDVGMVGVAAITVICYLAAQAIKATKIDNKWIPVLCGVIGMVLGIVGMFAMPDFPTNSRPFDGPAVQPSTPPRAPIISNRPRTGVTHAI